MRRQNGSGLMIVVVAVISLAVGAALSSVFAGTGSALTTGGAAGDVEQTIAQVIENNPQLIVDAFQKGRMRQQQEQQAKMQENVVANREKLEKNDNSPFVGNPKGDVVVVEFFDYACGYCKRAHADVEKLLAADKNVKFVFKEFPILGPGSEIASRAALAVHFLEPTKYAAIHKGLMEFQGQKTEEAVLEIAKKVGVDAAKVKEEMKSSRVSAALQSNQEIGRSIGISGTPAFVIGGQLIPGAIGVGEMQAAIAQARKK